MNFYCIDDDSMFLNSFKNLMIVYSFQKNIEITTRITTNIPESIPLNIDAFFLDVEIGTEKIFSFVEKIRSRDALVPIIIISSHDIYILNSVKYNIFDFIRKNKLNEEIYETLDRLLKYLDMALPFITFKCNDILMKLKMIDIVYTQLSSHKTIIYTQTDQYVVNNDYNLIFKEKCNRLIQIHRSYYINPHYLLSLKTDKVILDNNINLPLGKKYKKKVIDYYMKKYII